LTAFDSETSHGPLDPVIVALIIIVIQSILQQLLVKLSNIMIRTHIIECNLPKSDADALNRESGRVYTGVMVEHWRVYRKHAIWLSRSVDEKLSDYYTQDDPALLHSHSKDAAQQAFATACKTTHALRAVGIDAHFPHRRKYYRTSIWKNTGIRMRAGVLLLARSKGLSPVSVTLPVQLAALSGSAFVEARLVFDRVTCKYTWHLVVEDGAITPLAPGNATLGIDMGEIHPAVCTDGLSTVVVSCKALRALRQYTQKRGSRLQSLMGTKTKGSRRWKRLKKRDNRFRAQQKRRIRDLEHKISREVVRFALENKAGTIAIGDVRDIADKTDKGHVQNQRMSTWDHGRVCGYITYKAQYVGMKVVLVDEYHTTQSCPTCGQRTKPKGRTYVCLACGFRGHRDAVGAANILSRQLHGKLTGVLATEPKYRFPHPVWVKRSRLDTAELACAGVTVQEATGL
jgi:putative transposase